MSEFEMHKMLSDLVTEVRMLRLEVMKLKDSSHKEMIRGRFLDMKEACEYLHISRTTMHNRLSSGEIGFAVKRGKSWMFPADKLEAYACAVGY